MLRLTAESVEHGGAVTVVWKVSPSAGPVSTTVSTTVSTQIFDSVERRSDILTVHMHAGRLWWWESEPSWKDEVRRIQCRREEGVCRLP